MTVTAVNYTEVVPLVDYIKSKYNIEFVALNRFIPNSYLPENINKMLIPTIDQLESTLSDLDILNSKYPDMNLKYAIHFPHCIIKNEKLRKYIGRCGFGEHYCSIDMNGNMQMCSYGGPILGNVFSENLIDIWNNNSTLNSYRSEDWMPKKCKDCTYRNNCVSGCKVSSGIDPFAPDILLNA
ncbi:SPASM domain-containing protein [Clostridium taeniosporum]|uniref:4Fe4S-binding SPASM domain-containing protein n=1 Tax=Clostridium taeniosporum TaxID=394958 RepID=A0A1D7XNV4_9CLOT|nr:SPASM domain-containing protein [Clostridium taeniosporum]AOR24996.1 hypothetical protein BGI42_14715 [Clostridium taeniosporum]